MSPLPPFVAKLIASDGYEEKKYFDTKGAAEKWVFGEGKEKFDGDIQRAEIHHVRDGLVWSKDRHERSGTEALLKRPKERYALSAHIFSIGIQHATVNPKPYTPAF